MKRILVVDDSAAMRMMIISSIESLGEIEVTEASNGFEALRILPLQTFDLIITDINMPTINGLEIINFVRNRPNYKEIPVVIVTTEKAQKDKDKGMALGANAYIVKPFDPENLKKIVSDLLITQQ